VFVRVFDCCCLLCSFCLVCWWFALDWWCLFVSIFGFCGVCGVVFGLLEIYIIVLRIMWFIDLPVYFICFVWAFSLIG